MKLEVKSKRVSSTKRYEYITAFVPDDPANVHTTHAAIMICPEFDSFKYATGH
jgi:hypothetical protein